MVSVKVGLFVGLFVLLIVGLVLIGVIGDNVDDIGVTKRTVNQSRTWTAGVGILDVPIDVRNNDKVQPTTVRFNNGTNNTIGNNNWLAYTNGSVIMLEGFTDANTFGANPLVNVTFSYFGEKYVRDATSRTFINLIPLFFAIAILLMVIGRSIGMSPELFKK